jgi:hypothetical protein
MNVSLPYRLVILFIAPSNQAKAQTECTRVVHTVLVVHILTCYDLYLTGADTVRGTSPSL